jgi:putative hydrolase of the HAD superfamily
VILSFDLDDTLYPEITYVHSGFRAVAAWMAAELGVPEGEAYRVMAQSLEEDGRGEQFDLVLRRFDQWSKARVARLVSVYRTHRPRIELPEESRLVLEAVAGRPLYLVTDGNQTAQQAKVDALGVARYFRHCYLTNRYGPNGAKPSTKVFELMLRRERASGEELIYVGDNPAKDFVGVRSMGGRTIRVLTGGHAAAVAAPGHDADITVSRLAEVPAALASL